MKKLKHRIILAPTINPYDPTVEDDVETQAVSQNPITGFKVFFFKQRREIDTSSTINGLPTGFGGGTVANVINAQKWAQFGLPNTYA